MIGIIQAMPVPSKRRILMKIWDRDFELNVGAELEEKIVALADTVEKMAGDRSVYSPLELGMELSDEIDRILGPGASMNIFGDVPAPSEACVVLETIAQSYLGYRKLIEGEI